MRHVRRSDDRRSAAEHPEPAAVRDRSHAERDHSVHYGHMLVGRVAVRRDRVAGGEPELDREGPRQARVARDHRQLRAPGKRRRPRPPVQPRLGPRLRRGPGKQCNDTDKYKPPHGSCLRGRSTRRNYSMNWLGGSTGALPITGCYQSPE